MSTPNVIIKGFLIISIILTSLNLTTAQSSNFKNKYFKRSQFKEKKETLRQRFAKNKIIPKKIELATLVALSHYPELAKEHIVFKFRKISSTMKAQPRLNFIFKKREKRKYVVFINTETDLSTGLALENLSFNALVGWIGHELGHIADYVNKSNWRVVRTGLGYLSKKYISKYEKSIDTITIQHGLGYALYEGMEYVYQSKRLSKTYKQNLIENYLSLSEIAQQIEKYEANL